MKRAIAILFLLISSMAFAGGCAKVEPGYVGILVHMYGDQRGVDDFPLQTGRVWYNPITHDLYKFPTYLQNEVWTADKQENSRGDESITFNSREGAFFNADVAVSYQLDAEMVPALFVEFRKPIDHITDVYMRSRVRDTFNEIASTYEAMEIVGIRKEEFLKAIKANLEEELGPRGFKFDMISMTGKPRLDPKVESAINEALQATQKAIEAENKVRQIKAEAQQARDKAIGQGDAIKTLAEQQAEANRLVAASLTPDLVQWQAIQQWDGVLPRVTGDAVPLIQVTDD